LQVHDDRVFASEFPGNPTLINDQPLQGEQELHDRDCIKVGRLKFTIRLESESAQPSSGPASGAEPEEEVAGSLLLAMCAGAVLGYVSYWLLSRYTHIPFAMLTLVFGPFAVRCPAQTHAFTANGLAG